MIARIQGLLDWAQLKVEFEENRRLRLGITMIAALVLIWLSLVLSDFNAAQYKKVRQLNLDKLSLVEIEPTNVWRERLSQTRLNVTRHEERLWRADSDGLAMAKLQADLAKLIVKDEIQKQVIKVGTPQPSENLDAVLRIRARLAVNLTSEQLAETLLRIENHQHRIVIEQLNMKKVRNRWSVDAQVSTHFLIGGEDS